MDFCRTAGRACSIFLTLGEPRRGFYHPVDRPHPHALWEQLKIYEDGMTLNCDSDQNINDIETLFWNTWRYKCVDVLCFKLRLMFKLTRLRSLKLQRLGGWLQKVYCSLFKCGSSFFHCDFVIPTELNSLLFNRRGQIFHGGQLYTWGADERSGAACSGEHQRFN